MTLKRTISHSATIILLLTSLPTSANPTEEQEPVTLERGDLSVLGNGIVRLGIDAGGTLRELSYRDGPNLAASGYWNFNGNGYDAQGKPIGPKFAALNGEAKVLRQSDDLVELAFVRRPAEPMLYHATLHYVLRRGDPGFHLYMTAAHDADMPPGFITQFAYNLRLNPDHFDYIAVDDARRHISHTCRDEATADEIMDATYRLPDGRVVSKYNYTHAIEDDAFNLYGWAGPQIGVWWIQASGEYYGSAPFRVLLTSHQTTTTPVIIWQAHCTHRGGCEIEFPPGDTTSWQKLYGPVFVYLNAAQSYDAMWDDAKQQVDSIKAQWPPPWMSHQLFPLQRGEVTGTLVFDDNTPVADARVILAPEGVHWSQENKGYHFWTKTDANGHFSIEHVRPGRYTLFALGADQFYEFKTHGIDVGRGKQAALGTLSWGRIVHGKRIWQIGTADRSTGEFTNGDDFHHWGLWRRYPTDFPNDVLFEIGNSTERKDWNFAHWNWYSQKNAWDIAFQLNKAPSGVAVLTFGIAAARGHSANGYGSRDAAELRIYVNDKEAGRITAECTGGDSYRSARQSTRYTVEELRFDADLLREDRNVISLRHAVSQPYKDHEDKGERGSGPGCIMYDAIRLEIETAPLTIVAPEAKRNDAGLALALKDLTEALQRRFGDTSLLYHEPQTPLPVGNVIVVGHASEVPAQPWKPAKAEEYRIGPITLSGQRAMAIEGDDAGLAYGVFKLAERVRLGDDLWSISIQAAPAFPLRFYSEEGQLLDIPDMGYYSEQPPYVNEPRLREEVDEAKHLVDHALRQGFNTLVVLHLNFEEYIDYRYLDNPVYEPDDRHLVRSPVFCKYMTELCDYAHARHIDVYLQLYELQYPPRLDDLYGVQLDSPNIEKIIRAKTRELFERVPLDGLYITATESHPRCGYRSSQIWRPQGRLGAATMVTLFNKACSHSGKRAIFRLWRIAGDADGAREVSAHIPPDAMLSVKNTGGDFFINRPTTSAITDGATREQPFTVIFDTFRQYDGWSRLFVYMKQWGDAVRACRENGVLGINAWADWSSGCIWPDWEPGYLTDEKGHKQTQRVSWAGYWNTFRMFTRGFTPGQSNTYLISRLAWDPNVAVDAIARDFAALHLGPANARAGGEALMATEDAFREEYVGGAHPVYIKWTMAFGPRPKMMKDAYKNNSIERILTSNAKALAAVERMEQAFAEVDPRKAPDPKRYAEFREGIDKTALYLRTFYRWREAWWRHTADQDLTGQAKSDNAQALVAVKEKLKELFDQWSRFPEEAGFWRVTFRYGRPQQGSSTDGTFPSWHPEHQGEQTMESTAESF